MDIIGTGNALDNTIYGGSGNTFIYGGEGNDVLNGEAVSVDIIFDTTEENYGVAATGRAYNNHYCALFHLRDGQIVFFNKNLAGFPTSATAFSG